MENKNQLNCKLAVIGTGMAGIAASVFASNRGLDVVQVGDSSEINFASGCLDLLAVNPLGSLKYFKNPWEGIDSLLNVNPDHPYGFVSKDSIRSGLNEFSGFMSSVNLPCKNYHKKNQHVITPAGTLKTTFCVPLSMGAGAEAVEAKKKILIVDIKGLKGFSSIQMAENLKKYELDVTPKTVEFPGKEDSGELNCERMAWELEMGRAFDLFTARIKEKIEDEQVIGLPAIIGIYNSEALRTRLEKVLGLPVFEIPTFSPSVPGLRMKEKFLERLKEKGINLFPNTRVNRVERDYQNNFVFTVERGIRKIEVTAENLILATGRFFGRGLRSSDSHILEPLFDIPVSQPETRDGWYERDFFEPRGHEINRCGVKTDCFFRPLDKSGEVMDKNLYAVGSILANQDWKREKSGSGIGIVSSYSAVSSISRKLSLGEKSLFINNCSYGRAVL